MGKLVAVWGSPESGKTTFAVKLATAVYDQFQSTVLTVLADQTAPALSVLFPNRKKEDLSSVGTVLAKTEITQEEVIKCIVTDPKRANFGFLGYMDGENVHTYAKAGERKCRDFLNVTKTLADVVVVDCTSLPDNLSKVAINMADEIVRLASPDLKSMAFFNSQLPIMADTSFRCEEHILGINVVRQDVYIPLEEAKEHFGKVSFTVPYSQEIRIQTINGALIEPVKDAKFNDRLRIVAQKLVE